MRIPGITKEEKPQPQTEQETQESSPESVVEQKIIEEREITLSLLNQKLNYLIIEVQKLQKK